MSKFSMDRQVAFTWVAILFWVLVMIGMFWVAPSRGAEAGAVGGGAAATPAAPSSPQPVPCQTPSPCKIIILSSEEEQALTAPNQILDTAMQGRPLDLVGKVLYFRDKLRNAPPGSNVQPEAPK